MVERKLLELAPGSRWAYGGEHLCGEYAIDAQGGIHLSISTATKTLLAVDAFWGSGEQRVAVEGADLVALLHRAGLLDGLLAEAYDLGYDHAQEDVGLHASRPDRNPYRKAGENV